MPKCWEKQHEKRHCYTPFGVPQMLAKTRIWEQCPHMLADKARGKWQIDLILPKFCKPSNTTQSLPSPLGPEAHKSSKRVRTESIAAPLRDPKQYPEMVRKHSFRRPGWPDDQVTGRNQVSTTFCFSALFWSFPPKTPPHLGIENSHKRVPWQ